MPAAGRAAVACARQVGARHERRGLSAQVTGCEDTMLRQWAQESHSQERLVRWGRTVAFELCIKRTGCTLEGAFVTATNLNDLLHAD